MLLSELQLGRPLEIYINREDYNYRIISKIEYVQAGCVCVTLIASEHRVFQFLETDVIDIVYQEQDRMWKWAGVRADVVTLDGDQVHAFFSEDPGENYNRRNAFRLYLGKELTIRYMVREFRSLTELEKEEGVNKQVFFNFDKSAGVLKEDCYRWVDCRAFIRDISEVGVGIYANERFRPEDEICFDFNSDLGMISCRAQIVRMREHAGGSFRNYYGCRFMETSRNLTKYLYEQQRIQLQNSNSIVRRK